MHSVSQEASSLAVKTVDRSRLNKNIEPFILILNNETNTS